MYLELTMTGHELHAQARIVEADLSVAEHQRAIVALTAAYAEDPMGNAGPLAADVLERLVEGLQRHPTTIVLLAYAGQRPVGIATCFLGFSTFNARPLVNIHDLAVLPGARGSGVGRQLLAAVEAKARALGCCRITLEVHEGNARAKRIYERAGFGPIRYGSPPAPALFYSKALELG